MDWKEFLKPNLAKLLIGIVIFILFVPNLTLGCNAPCTSRAGTLSCVNNALYSENAASLIIMFLSGWHCSSDGTKLGFPAYWIIGIPVAYLVSCLLFVLYYKIKKGKK